MVFISLYQLIRTLSNAKSFQNFDLGGHLKSSMKMGIFHKNRRLLGTEFMLTVNQKAWSKLTKVEQWLKGLDYSKNTK